MNSLANAVTNSVATAGALPTAPGTPQGAMPGAAPSAATPDATGAPPGGAPVQRQVTVDEVKQAIKKQALIDGKMRALLKDGKPVPRKEAISMAVGLVAGRALSAEEMAGYLTTLPQDPMQVREWLEKHAEKIEANLGQMMQMLEQSAMPPQTLMGGPAGGSMADAIPASQAGGAGIGV